MSHSVQVLAPQYLIPSLRPPWNFAQVFASVAQRTALSHMVHAAAGSHPTQPNHEPRDLREPLPGSHGHACWAPMPVKFCIRTASLHSHMGGGSPRLTAFLFLFPFFLNPQFAWCWPCQWRAMERALLRQRPQHRIIESRSCAEPTEIEILRSLLQRWTKPMHGWLWTRPPLVQLRPWRGNRSMLLRLPWSWTTLPCRRRVVGAAPSQ